jgi:hypothetical protein
MIKDLDETIKQLLVQKASLDSSEVNISFESPNREWAASQSKPTVNLYLYDIRENHELRSYEWTVEKNEDKTSTRKKSPLRLDLSFFITLWTNHIEDEHRLLGNLLICLMSYPVLPKELLQGSLKGLDYPIHASTAQPEGVLKSPADFWTTMDSQLKPSINYVVTLPVDLSISFVAPLVFTKSLAVENRSSGVSEEDLQILGTIFSGKPRKEVANAILRIKELNVTTTSDATGKFHISRLTRGTYTFEISAPKRASKEVRMVVPGKNYDIEL